MRKAMRESGEGGWTFPLPLTCHHLVILSVTCQPLFQTPALAVPLMVWTVEGYLTMYLVSFENGVGQTEM